MKLTTIAALTATLFASPGILPAEVLTLDESHFTVATGPFTTSDSLDATFTTLSNLAASTTTHLADPDLASATVTDGATTFSATNSTLNLWVTTNGAGAITDWCIEGALTSDGNQYFWAGGPVTGGGGDTALSFDPGLNTNYDYAQTASGGAYATQSQPFSASASTPEPGTAGMLLLGALLIVGGQRWKKVRD